MLTGGFVAALGCVLLLVAWFELRPARALLWWAVAFLLDALAVAALAPGYDHSSRLLVIIAAGLMPLAAAAIWGVHGPSAGGPYLSGRWRQRVRFG